MVSNGGEKKLAAEAAAELVQDGMRVGLGTGSTVAFLLPALAARELDVRCVATSPATEERRASSALRVESFAASSARARHRDRRRRPGRAGRLAGQGRRRGAHAREDRRRGGRPLRRDRLLGQARRPARAAGAARAARVRPARRRSGARPGRAARRAAEPGRRRDRRLHRARRRPARARGAASRDAGLVEHGLFRPRSST